MRSSAQGDAATQHMSPPRSRGEAGAGPSVWQWDSQGCQEHLGHLPESGVGFPETITFHLQGWTLSWGCRSRLPQLGGLNQQASSRSQIWRAEVQSQSVHRAALPPEAPIRFCSLPLLASKGCRHSLACGYVTPISASVFP